MCVFMSCYTCRNPLSLKAHYYFKATEFELHLDLVAYYTNKTVTMSQYFDYCQSYWFLCNVVTHMCSLSRFHSLPPPTHPPFLDLWVPIGCRKGPRWDLELWLTHQSGKNVCLVSIRIWILFCNSHKYAGRAVKIPGGDDSSWTPPLVDTVASWWLLEKKSKLSW